MFNTTMNEQHAADVHRNAYNAAFYELGLSWYWDADTCSDAPCERSRLRKYLETQQSHLLKAYEADFLIDAIQTTKARCYETLSAAGTNAAQPVNWAEIQRAEVGV